MDVLNQQTTVLLQKQKHDISTKHKSERTHRLACLILIPNKHPTDYLLEGVWNKDVGLDNTTTYTVSFLAAAAVAGGVAGAAGMVGSRAVGIVGIVAAAGVVKVLAAAAGVVGAELSRVGIGALVVAVGAGSMVGRAIFNGSTVCGFVKEYEVAQFQEQCNIEVEKFIEQQKKIKTD